MAPGESRVFFRARGWMRCRLAMQYAPRCVGDLPGFSSDGQAESGWEERRTLAKSE
jgi:hypothetical protein